MSIYIPNHSKFYYGHTVNADNQYLSFDEGSGELIATINIGSYTLSSLAIEVARAMTAIGTQDYLVTVDRSNRFFTISSTLSFDLLFLTGSTTGQSIGPLIGFDVSDFTGMNSYTGNNPSGNEYKTQFPLQSYVPSTLLHRFQSANVNISTSGVVEVVYFGTENFIEFELLFITNIDNGDHYFFRSNINGVSDFINFITFAITKAKFEFMPDENDADTYESVLLESTEESQDGVGFRLKEEYDRGLPGYFRSGIITLRKVEF